MSHSDVIYPTQLDNSQLEKVEHFFNASIKKNLPVAVWRLPNSHSINTICQLEERNQKFNSIENAPPGFLFHPFEESDTSPQKFIQADVLMLDNDIEINLSPSSNKSPQTFDSFLAAIEEVKPEAQFDFTQYLDPSPRFQSTHDEFVNLVAKCKNSIQKGYYQKIVPSRREKFKIKKDFRPVSEFFKLCRQYENAFVSLVYFPNEGLWLGASPELLISLKAQKKFETISLAGTQEIPLNFDLSKAAWTQKEIEEQALVSRYIVNCFKKIRLREFDEFGPKTAKAGNLMHLKTVFRVDMDQVNFPELGSVMLDLLHPTSAVCGMPMMPAAKFLNENEGYDRQYFSGYLGPVNINEDIDLFVNLRCARIHKDAGILFAGAGVTEDSDEESEWNETNIKFQTLLNVIDKG